MKFMYTILTIILSGVFVVTRGQLHYVPAQLLVPVYNTTNYTAHNNSVPNYGWNVPSNGGSNGYRPYNPHNNSNWSIPHNGNQNGYRPYYRNGSVSNITTPDGNLMLGTIGLYDRLLFSKTYYKPSRWWSSREKIIQYPKDVASGYVRHETISAIRIYNLLYNHEKARAEVLAGGIGRQFAKIRLSSNWGNGFKYLLQIYGH